MVLHQPCYKVSLKSLGEGEAPAATGEESDFFCVDTCAADQRGEPLLFEAPTVIYVSDHLFENSPTTARGPSKVWVVYHCVAMVSRGGA